MKITVTTSGSMKDMFRQVGRDMAVEATMAVAEAGLALREELRQQTRAAGLGDRVARAWQWKMYPQGRISYQPAALVWTKAPNIIQAFSEGTLITAQQGKFLAIPTEHAPRLGAGNKRISPKNWNAARYGELRFVPRGARPPLLVVDNQRQRTGKHAGKFARAAARTVARGRGISTVVMFILLPQVKMQKLLDLDAAGHRAQALLQAKLATRLGARA